MGSLNSQGQPSKESDLIAMRKAIMLERKSRYSDMKGRRATFSQFMYRTAARLARQYPLESAWMTLRGLFRQYRHMDLPTRISIAYRAEELLAPFWALLRDKSSETKTTDGKQVRIPVSTNMNQLITNTGDEPADAKTTHNLGCQAVLVRELSEAPCQAEKASTYTSVDSAAGSLRTIVNESKSGYLKSKYCQSEVENRKTNEPESYQIVDSIDGATNIDKRLSDNLDSKTEKKIRGEIIRNVNDCTDTNHIRSKNNDADINQTPVQYVKGVGPKVGSQLAKFGIETVGDLLRHYPRQHLDFQNRVYIRDFNVGAEVSVFGIIKTASAFQSKKRNMSVLNVTISDGTGTLLITRFVGGKSNKYLLDRYKQQYPKGAQVMASGIAEKDRQSGRWKLKNAEVELLSLASDEESFGANSLHAGRLVPVYPLTEGMSLRYLRTIINNALEGFGNLLSDVLPLDLRSELGLMDLSRALKSIHFPETREEWALARKRLVFDELFSIQLQLAHRRYSREQDSHSLSLSLENSSTGYIAKLLDSLPFKLTSAQERVFKEIANDLESDKPMHRLVQGDVGSGKTIVALLAFLIAIENGFQGAMMAPTEILAEQHYRQFQRLLTPLGLRCAIVLGKQGIKQRREIRQAIFSGQVDIAVGTHALIEDGVEFRNLGLIIIDEQHRFGVKQRARLKSKSQYPELLTMTATPIPRTLALTMHGDLDVSEIDELPPGRKPIETKLMRPSERSDLWKFILNEVKAGRQAYIVFPLIDESESLSAKAASAEYEKLKNKYSDLRFGLMHGKLKPQEKEQVMEQFRSGQFQILVSTTVIEVGVDVPNATIMVIENADRFGLAQLHQLRGRVGRGGLQSYCFLLSDSKSDTTRERLEILTRTNDGFVVAEKDLEIRGPGEFMGFKQSGLPDLVLTDLVADAEILEAARNAAIKIVRQDPELKSMPELLKLLKLRSKSIEAEAVRSG